MDKGAIGAQKPLLIGVENRDERYLGEVEALAQQVDPDQHVELTEPQAPNDLDALDRVDFGVQVAYADPVLLQVVGEVLGHTLGERRDQDPLVALLPQADLVEQVVHLPFHRTHVDRGVHEPGRADDLLHHDAPRELELFVPRRGRDEHHARDEAHELGDPERPVIERRGKPEPVVHEGLLAGAVPLVHPAELRHRLVRLVDDAEVVVGEVVEQARGTLPHLATGEVAGIVLDPGAAPDLEHHVDVEAGARLEALRLEQLVLRPQLREALPQLLADRGDGALDRGPLGHEVGRRIDRRAGQLGDRVSRRRVDLRDALHRVTPEFDADGLLVVRREDLDRVPPHAERAALEGDVVAPVLHGYERLEQLVATALLPDGRGHEAPAVHLRVAQAVDRGHARNDDHVVALHQARRGPQPQPVDVVVDRGVLGDVGVRLGDVRLGLVIVVIGDEELDRVLREESLQLPVQLCGEGLVVGQHQGRAVEVGEDVRHGERLARARDAQQRLIAVAPREALGQLADGARLVPRRRVGGNEVERHPQKVNRRAAALGDPTRGGPPRSRPSTAGLPG